MTNAVGKHESFCDKISLYEDGSGECFCDSDNIQGHMFLDKTSKGEIILKSYLRLIGILVAICLYIALFPVQAKAAAAGD